MTLNMPYDEVVERIVSETNLSKDEVIKRINDKVDELGGLITLEGAAHIIARELEINLYDSQQIQKLQPTKISELIDGMNNVTITAMIKHVYEPKSFSRNDGTQGAVQNAQLVDKTGFCRLVLWDDQIRQFNDYGISRGDIIRISGAFVKESKFDSVKELSLNSRSQIDTDPKGINEKDYPGSLLEQQKIKNLSINQFDVELLGKITAIKPASNFSKKDGSEGSVSSLEIADETGKVRITLWDTKAEEIIKFKVTDIVEIVGGYTRQGMNGTIEVHLGKNGAIIKKPNVKIEIPEEILKEESSIRSISNGPKEASKEVRLSDLNENMSNISVLARITGISDIREFERKDGTKSVVGSLIVIDNSGPGRITIWNSMTDYIKTVEIGDVIRIENAYVRLGLRGEPEVHVGKGATIEINPEYLTDAIPELTIKYTNLADLEANMKDVNVKAKIMRIQEIRTFTKNDGEEGHVLNIGISDNTGSVRLVAWDSKAIELEALQEMTSIEILHGYTKEGMQGVEIHLGTLSTIQQLEKAEALEFSDIKLQKNLTSEKTPTKRVDMVDLEEDQFSEIRGTLLKIYEGKMYYYSCPECRKKIVESEDSKWKCEEHGTVEPQKTIFISIALDDGTGCVRVTFFREQAEQLIDMSSDNLIDEIENSGIQAVISKLEQRNKGREIVVKGKCRKNKFDDGMDLIASSFYDAETKTEIDLAKGTLNI
ncbi:MAG: DUF2240 family protein [Candidatus Heimdallarchaeota archaeon]|nr:DUF2240 family protein [Candidatus Heimdallarchaeota archaeon]